MRTVELEEAQTTLPSLLEAVDAGEEVLLARSGRPIARLIAWRRPIGIDDDRLEIAEDFDDVPAGFEPYI